MGCRDPALRLVSLAASHEEFKHRAKRLFQRCFSEDFARINETRLCGESISTFQLKEQRKRRTVIDKLTLDDGSHLTEINVHIEGFFRNLYTTHDSPKTITDNTFTSTLVMPEDCETNPDGIPREFYLRAFSTIQRELLRGSLRRDSSKFR